MGLRFCFFSRKFVLLDYFDLIVDIFSGYIARDRGLYDCLREFGISNRFESIAGGFSGSVARRDRKLFCLTSKFLSSWLVGRYIITSPNN